MVIALMGDSCVGKSTIAECLEKKINAEVVSGKDYLRLAKSESEARVLFRKKLEGAAAAAGENIIYVISEKDQIAFLPEGSLRVLVAAGLESIKQRFAVRMHGNLPTPVAAMLERKYGQFEGEAHEARIDTEVLSPEEACGEIMRLEMFRKSL